MNLTKGQKSAIKNMEINGRVYVGFCSPRVIRLFDSLVKKGLATSVLQEQKLGNYYRLKEN